MTSASVLPPVATRVLERLASEDAIAQERFGLALERLLAPWLAGESDTEATIRRLELAAMLNGRAAEARDEVRRRATAFHEAGHAIAALALGVPVASVSVVPNGHRQALGEVVPGPIAHRVSRETWIVVQLAGPAAQIMATGPDEATVDSHRAIASRLAHRTVPGLDDCSRVHFLSYCESRARHLVQLHWLAVSAVATALLEHGTLDAEQLAGIVPPGLTADATLVHAVAALAPSAETLAPEEVAALLTTEPTLTLAPSHAA